VTGIDACLKCTICVSACPVYRHDSDFPGPKALGPEWQRRRAAGDLMVMDHVDDCTFCQLCELACPVGVPIAHLIAEQKDAARLRQPLAVGLRDNVLTHPEWVARAPMLTAASSSLARWMHLSTHSRRPRPRTAGSLAKPLQSASRGVVGLLVDCFDRGFDQETVTAATSLLRLWGFEAAPVPERSLCCGAAAYASGRVEQAKGQARAMREAISQELPTNVERFVTLNATCDGTVDQEWEQYLGLEPLPMPILPFHEFALAYAPLSFWEVLNRGSEHESEGVSTPVWTHTTCRGRRRGDGSLGLLAQRAGAQAVSALDLECCGAAGSYAFKAEHEVVAHRMGSEAKEQIGGSAGELWVDSGTCAVHLDQITGVPSRHPAYWLYQRWQRASKLQPRPELGSDPRP